MDSSSISSAAGLVRMFGPFRLYPDQQLLLRGENPVKLGGRGFDLLNLLVERQGEVVSKRELIAATWPDTFVQESNLKVNMFSLRRALGEASGISNYIVTVPGRGYRFIAPVRTSREAKAAAPSMQHRQLPQLGEIIGRQSEIGSILEKLRDNRHVTIVGTGGVGKTTLAIATAQHCRDDFPDGICMVDLSVIDDPMLVPATIASALRLRSGAADHMDAVTDFLQHRRMLILLDNCEHVLHAAAILSTRLAAASRCGLLAASRAPLATTTEQVFWLEPLGYPPTDRDMTLDEVQQYPAARLLIRRAFDVAGYEAREEDVSALARICRSLDGIPLAIELAAGKLARHGATELLSMLHDHLAILERRDAAVPHRQRTLSATIDWSYRLLTREEAALFQAISIFAGTFGAADVVAIAVGMELSAAGVAAALGSLIAKSLVAATADDQDMRYRLLDTTRRYALEQLRQHPLYEKVCRAHAERMVEIFERSEREWDWREPEEWSASYQDRLPDLRKALNWTFRQGGDAEIGVRLTIASIPVLFKISAMAEVGERALEAMRHPVSDFQRMKLASSHAWSMLYAAKREYAAERSWQDAIEFAKRNGDIDYQLRGLLGYSFHLSGTGRLDQSLERLTQFRSLARDNPGSPAAADGERFFAFVNAYLGNLNKAQRILDRLVLATPKPGQRSRMAGFQVDRYIGTRTYLSFVSWLTGRPRYAARVAEEGIHAASELGHLVSQSNVLAMSALPIAFWNGDIQAMDAYAAHLKANLDLETTGLWKPIMRFYCEVLAEARDGSANTDTMFAIVEELVAARFTIRLGFYLGVIAEIFLSRGQVAEAGGQLQRAFDYQQRQNERWSLSELLRIKAAILAKDGNIVGAEIVLENALLEARSSGAKSFELRIATDLANHHIEAGQPDQAVRTIEPILTRFVDGTTTKDLAAAARTLELATALRRG